MPLRIVSWNIENFGHHDSEGKPQQHYAAKLAHVSERLNQLDADVVALQEVLDEEALSELAKRTARHYVSAPADHRGNRVALLLRDEAQTELILDYRLPKGTVVQRFDDHAKLEATTELRRPFLQATIAHAGQPVTVISAHLKSKLHTFPGGLFSTSDEALRAAVSYFDIVCRAAEAATLRAHVSELLAGGANVLVCLDANDGPRAATTEILYGPPGSQLRVPEDAEKEASGFTRGDSGDPQRLFNLTLLVPEARRWSRIASGAPELLDHILCSERLMLPRKGKLRRVPVVEILNEALQSVGEQPRKDSGVPDHAPVVATFDL